MSVTMLLPMAVLVADRLPAGAVLLQEVPGLERDLFAKSRG
jgi:hypothetical protein